MSRKKKHNTTSACPVNPQPGRVSGKGAVKGRQKGNSATIRRKTNISISISTSFYIYIFYFSLPYFTFLFPQVLMLTFTLNVIEDALQLHICATRGRENTGHFRSSLFIWLQKLKRNVKLNAFTEFRDSRNLNKWNLNMKYFNMQKKNMLRSEQV